MTNVFKFTKLKLLNLIYTDLKINYLIMNSYIILDLLLFYKL